MCESFFHGGISPSHISGKFQRHRDGSQAVTATVNPSDKETFRGKRIGNHSDEFLPHRTWKSFLSTRGATLSLGAAGNRSG